MTQKFIPFVFFALDLRLHSNKITPFYFCRSINYTNNCHGQVKVDSGNKLKKINAMSN